MQRVCYVCWYIVKRELNQSNDYWYKGVHIIKLQITLIYLLALGVFLNSISRSVAPSLFFS